MKTKQIITAVALAATTMGTLAATPSFSDARHDRLTAQRNFWKGHAQNRARIIRAQRADLASVRTDLANKTTELNDIRDALQYASPAILPYYDSVMQQVADGDITLDTAQYTFMLQLDRLFSAEEQALIDMANSVSDVTTSNRSFAAGDGVATNLRANNTVLSLTSWDPITNASDRIVNIDLTTATAAAQIDAFIEQEKAESYSDGYNDGYVDGFADGVASVQDELN